MRDPGKKLEILKGSFESGIIGKEQYESEKKKLEHDIKNSEEKILESKLEAEEAPKKSSEKILIISIAVIIVLLGSIFAFRYFYKPQALTLEDLHALNLKGKLKPEQGYVYRGLYSFITQDQEWFTQLSSPKGTRVYDLALRYSPRDLKNITIEGELNTEFFDSQSDYYVTFNPTGNQLQYVGLAVADFETHMSKVFEKTPIAACDRNETQICQTRPIVTCGNSGNSTKLVLYIRESDRFRAYYNDNCIVVEGSGFDLVRGVDRILYNLYHVMGKQAE